MQDIYYTYLPRDQGQGVNLVEGKDVFFEDSGLGAFLRYSSYNGEIISALAHQLVKSETIKKNYLCERLLPVDGLSNLNSVTL